MLNQAELTTGIYVWLKTIFINLFENYSSTQIKYISNMNVVYYEQSKNNKQSFYGVFDKPVWFSKSIAPFQTIRNYFYGDLKQFSKIIVKIDKNNKASIDIIDDNLISKPNYYRNLFNSKYFIISSILFSIGIYKKSFRIIKNIYKR